MSSRGGGCEALVKSPDRLEECESCHGGQAFSLTRADETVCPTAVYNGTF